VHAQPQSVVEPEEHLLAHCSRFDHDATVDLCGSGSEAPLGRRCSDALADEVKSELPSDSVY
jgi:hypothetical protein